MAKLVWDQTGSRFYETGIEQCALYPISAETNDYPVGYAWSGITSVTESPSGAEASPFYADNIKYLNLISAEDFGCTIEAYTYPDEFAECDGSATLVKGVTIGQQPRKTFGLAYKTRIGNDVTGDALGYKLHLVYGCLASPSEKAYSSVNDSPEPATFSWEITTTPVNVSGTFKPTSHLEIDSRTADAAKLTAFEAILYGAESGNGPRLPLPSEVATLLAPSA